MLVEVGVLNCTCPHASLQVCADQRFMSAGLCRALFEVYFGGNAVVPEARESFAAGVKNLIEADNVSRGEWKPGGRGTDID